ncbi:MAG: hypothetical protein JO002_17125 [Burkholderiaceae bacterium]|nr:hypothetical protein [Burkholderiaceae bacterium]
MKKVAVFGAPGAGKSTLSKQLATMRQLPLYALDMLFYEVGGGEVPPEVYAQRHAEILAQDAWLMEGFGNFETLWPRLAAADTLVYVDLPFMLHAWWVAKRFFKGLFATPEGWPDRSPMLEGTLASYRALWGCHRHLTPKYRAYVRESAASKPVFHLRSVADIAHFLVHAAQLKDA